MPSSRSRNRKETNRIQVEQGLWVSNPPDVASTPSLQASGRSAITIGKPASEAPSAWNREIKAFVEKLRH
ncbi:hypothetical protein R1flu_005080 [Riccia fluitans]|uniref:Uncharacterized protein n=1 Tax=Riccia fluitans TaxID=41844 RepID=A0ABD1YS53_9MARC